MLSLYLCSLILSIRNKNYTKKETTAFGGSFFFDGASMVVQRFYELAAFFVKGIELIPKDQSNGRNSIINVTLLDCLDRFLRNGGATTLQDFHINQLVMKLFLTSIENDDDICGYG